MGGKIFLVNDDVRRQKDIVDIPGDGEVLALVDADGQNCIPDQSLLDAGKLRILLTSSPRTSKDRKWLVQSVGDSLAAYVMEPWSREELLIATFVYSGRLIRLLIQFIGCF
jgi:hypothetical protein